MRVPWTARTSNQSILKEISPGCSLEGLMLKLKLLYFGHLMQRVDSLENTMMLGGIEGRRRRERQRMPQGGRNLPGLGSSPFARHYWGNHCLFSLPTGTKMFQFPAFASTKVDSMSSTCWVVPFGNPRINGHLHLPAAYRSLSRPSSPVRA